jgi:hypothetical protein
MKMNAAVLKGCGHVEDNALKDWNILGSACGVVKATIVPSHLEQAG